jgi:hypothetical protein
MLDCSYTSFTTTNICPKITLYVTRTKREEKHSQKRSQNHPPFPITHPPLPLLLPRNPHLHRNRQRRTTSKRQPRPNRILKLSLRWHQLIKPLQQPHNNITSLSKSKLLPNTNPRPAVKRQKLPSRFAALEALGFEFFGIRAPQVFAPVHHVDAVVDFHVSGKDDGALPVGAAAAGERGDFSGATGVSWHDGPEAESLVEAVLEVCAAFQRRESDFFGVFVRAEVVDDGFAEFGEDFWVAEELVEEP